MYDSAESQKKKQQDDSDEYEDDESAASTSFQPQQVQPQQGYIPPMAQPGLPPVPGAPGMPPGKGAVFELVIERLSRNTDLYLELSSANWYSPMQWVCALKIV